MRVIRQIKGVDSNKLQPIIRFHQDKDFKVPSTSELPFLNYREIVLRPQRRVLEMNESSDNIENRTDDGEGRFSKKRLSANEKQPLISGKGVPKQLQNSKGPAKQSTGDIEDET